MRVLVDSSVWIDHLRVKDAELTRLLSEDLVLTHSGVIGELACGNLSQRAVFLGSLKLLPKITEASAAQVLGWIDSQRLYGRGLSWVDLQLLSSALLSGALLLTRDKRLQKTYNTLRAA